MRNVLGVPATQLVFRHALQPAMHHGSNVAGGFAGPRELDLLFFPALRNERLVGALGTAVVAVPFLIALYLFAGHHGEAEIATFYTWMGTGDLGVDFAYRIDGRSIGRRAAAALAHRAADEHRRAGRTGPQNRRRRAKHAHG